MAVLIAQQADEALCSTDTALRQECQADGMSTFVRLMTAPLPSDVREEEYTVAVLFRASLVLNFVTGGPPEMTFSARCHRSRRISRGLMRRAMWVSIAAGIDTACAVLRGEHAHCATAWANHRIRGMAARRA